MNDMSKLLEEVQQWNSPAVSAYLLWKFTEGYCSARSNADAPVALLHFLVYPILTSKRLLEAVSNRKPNLQSYVLSFEKQKNSDDLVNIHDMVSRNRSNAMNSIDMAVSTGLLFWDSESGKLHPRKETGRPRKGNSPRKDCVRNGKKATILGTWFAEHEISTIATYLKVVL